MLTSYNREIRVALVIKVDTPSIIEIGVGGLPVLDLSLIEAKQLQDLLLTLRLNELQSY